MGGEPAGAIASCCCWQCGRDPPSVGKAGGCGAGSARHLWMCKWDRGSSVSNLIIVIAASLVPLIFMRRCRYSGGVGSALSALPPRCGCRVGPVYRVGPTFHCCQPRSRITIAAALVGCVHLFCRCRCSLLQCSSDTTTAICCTQSVRGVSARLNISLRHRILAVTTTQSPSCLLCLWSGQKYRGCPSHRLIPSLAACHVGVHGGVCRSAQQCEACDLDCACTPTRHAAFCLRCSSHLLLTAYLTIPSIACRSPSIATTAARQACLSTLSLPRLQGQRRDGGERHTSRRLSRGRLLACPPSSSSARLSCCCRPLLLSSTPMRCQ